GQSHASYKRHASPCFDRGVRPLAWDIASSSDIRPTRRRSLPEPSCLARRLQPAELLIAPEPFAEHVFGIEAIVEAGPADLDGADERCRQRTSLAGGELEVDIREALADEIVESGRCAKPVLAHNRSPLAFARRHGVSQ